MGIKKRKTLIFVLVIMIVLIVASVVGILIYQHDFKVVLQHKIDQKYEKFESSFKKNPNIEDAIPLIEKYYYTGDYDKAEYFAKQCIELGVNETPLGYLVNFHLTLIYKQKQDLSSARKYLKTALKLDKHGIIEKNGWIEKDNLTKIGGVRKTINK